MMYQMNAKNAIKMAKNIYKEELKKESKDLSIKLDSLLDEL